MRRAPQTRGDGDGREYDMSRKTLIRRRGGGRPAGAQHGSAARVEPLDAKPAPEPAPGAHSLALAERLCGVYIRRSAHVLACAARGSLPTALPSLALAPSYSALRACPAALAPAQPRPSRRRD
jgi:hypothetical protein